MSLTVSDRLVIVQGIWVSYEGKDYMSHTVPLMDKKYILFEGVKILVHTFGEDDLEYIDWERGNPTIQRGWCFQWYDFGFYRPTENEWSDIYATKQEAFNNAYAYLNEGKDDGGWHDLEWVAFAKNNRLDDKAVITTMNGYLLKSAVMLKLETGDF